LHGVVIQVPKRKEFFFCELFFKKKMFQKQI
jgi:hypothetical protein